MANENYKDEDPFLMLGEGVPVESLNLFVLMGGLLDGWVDISIPGKLHEGIWNSDETPQKAYFCKFTLQNMTGTNNGTSLVFNTGQGCIIKSEIFLQMLDQVEKLQFQGTGLANLQVNVLKNYPSGGPEDVIIEDLDFSDPIVEILDSQMKDDSFYLELVATDNITLNNIILTIKTKKLPGEVALNPPIADGITPGLISNETYEQIYTNKDDILTKLNTSLVASTPTLSNKVQTKAELDSLAALKLNLDLVASTPTLSNKVQTKAELDALAALKVDKITGKGLSTQDFSTALKTKLENLGSDDVINESGVTGAAVTNALNQLKSQVDALTATMEARKHPIGFILASTSSINPATSLGYGTWERYAQGRVLVSEGGGFAAGATGGNKEITLAVNQLPSHKHNVAIPSSGGSETSTKTGLKTANDGSGLSNMGGGGWTGGGDAGNTGESSPSTNSTGVHSHILEYKNDAGIGGSGSRVRDPQYESDGTFNTGTQGLHSHTVNSHSHSIPLHQHSIAAHTHGTPAHQHNVNDHSHTVPNHTHTVSEDNIGSAAAVNIMPPYIVVYMWKRVS